MPLSLARRPSSSQQQPLAAAEDPTVVADGARKSDHSLSMLHACVHCRASKTACADERPCARCRRLGLECTSDAGEPRKRACRACHAAKVACGALFSDSCNRCRRLGLECVPREMPRPGSRIRRGGKTARLLLEEAQLAAHVPPQLGGPLDPSQLYPPPPGYGYMTPMRAPDGSLIYHPGPSPMDPYGQMHGPHPPQGGYNPFSPPVQNAFGYPPNMQMPHNPYMMHQQPPNPYTMHMAAAAYPGAMQPHSMPMQPMQQAHGPHAQMPPQPLQAQPMPPPESMPIAQVTQVLPVPDQMQPQPQPFEQPQPQYEAQPQPQPSEQAMQQQQYSQPEPQPQPQPQEPQAAPLTPGTPSGLAAASLLDLAARPSEPEAEYNEGGALAVETSAPAAEFSLGPPPIEVAAQPVDQAHQVSGAMVNPYAQQPPPLQPPLSQPPPQYSQWMPQQSPFSPPPQMQPPAHAGQPPPQLPSGAVMTISLPNPAPHQQVIHHGIQMNQHHQLPVAPNQPQQPPLQQGGGPGPVAAASHCIVQVPVANPAQPQPLAPPGQPQSNMHLPVANQIYPYPYQPPPQLPPQPHQLHPQPWQQQQQAPGANPFARAPFSHAALSMPGVPTLDDALRQRGHAQAQPAVPMQPSPMPPPQPHMQPQPAYSAAVRPPIEAHAVAAQPPLENQPIAIAHVQSASAQIQPPPPTPQTSTTNLQPPASLPASPPAAEAPNFKTSSSDGERDESSSQPSDSLEV